MQVSEPDETRSRPGCRMRSYGGAGVLVGEEWLDADRWPIFELKAASPGDCRPDRPRPPDN
jgi:hypothetical protein